MFVLAHALTILKHHEHKNCNYERQLTEVLSNCH